MIADCAVSIDVLLVPIAMRTDGSETETRAATFMTSTVEGGLRSIFFSNGTDSRLPCLTLAVKVLRSVTIEI